jgi:putative transposase
LFAAYCVIYQGSGRFFKKILAETCEQYGWKLETLETMPDHVHLFVRTDHMTAPIDIAKTLKSISAVYLFYNFSNFKR